MSKGLKTVLIIIGILVVFVIIMASWAIGQFNRAVAMDERVTSQWAQVENQLKRRYDLIPNLIETVKGYASHEKELFENIAKMRTEYFKAKTVNDKIKASRGLESVLSRLLLLKESYPQLKANQSFLKLQDSLEGTENRIAVERKRFNDSVRAINTYRRTVFGKIFAGLAGVQAGEYYEPPEAEKALPKVKF